MNINLTKRLSTDLRRLNGCVGPWYRLGRMYCHKLETTYYPIVLSVSLVVAGLVLMSLTLGGVFPIRLAAHDVFIPLEGAWRVLQGQVPNRDFRTTLGPILYWLYALGMRISGPNASSIVAVYAVVYVLTFLAAYYVASRRFNRAVALGLALFLAGVAACPAHYGWRLQETSVAGFYNRLGYAWLGLAAIGLCLPQRSCKCKLNWVDPLCLSLCLASLLLLKFSYGFAGLGLCALAMVIVPHRFRWKAVFCGALLIWIALAFFGIHWAWKPMVYEMGYVGMPGRTGLVILMICRSLYQNAIPLGALVGVQLFRLVSVWPSWPGKKLLYIILWAIETGAFAGLSIFVAAANTFHTEVAVLPVFVCILAWKASQERPFVKRKIRYPAVFMASSLAFLMVGGIGVQNYASFAYAGLWKLGGVRPEKLLPPNLAALPVLPGGGGGAHEEEASYQDVLNEGYETLMKCTTPADSVCVLDCSNPFSFALGRPCPRGGRLWWQYGVSFDEDNKPSETTMLSGADVVMLPKYPEDPPTTHALVRFWKVALERDFAPLVETKYWRILKRTIKRGDQVQYAR